MTPSFPLRTMVVFACAILWYIPLSAQTKKKVDTTIIFKEQQKKPTQRVYHRLSSSDSRKKVTVIKLNDTNKKDIPLPQKDTVIVLRKGKTKAQLAAEEKAKLDKLMKTNSYLCKCVKMDIRVSDTLQYQTYLNYKFLFKNNCKIDIWVSSKHFRYKPYNSFGKPVRVLRKLSFVKRFDYPDFVKIMPGETYTFSYGDDAFYEYDLRKGQAYKIIFEHRNFGDKSKQEPRKTYLCGQKRTHMVLVR